MFRNVLAARGLVALTGAAIVGTWGLLAHPVDLENPFLGLIALQKPVVFRVLSYGYATTWFTSSFFVVSLLTSVAFIVVSRYPERVRRRSLPPYPDPTTRPTPMLVLGEAHLPRVCGPSPEPDWLTIPQRGLYTGVMILGAVGTGKPRPACTPMSISYCAGARTMPPARSAAWCSK